MSRPPDSTLRRVQAITGLTFGLFLAAHLANTWIAGLSGELYDAVQRSLRVVYQAWYAETVVLGALVLHLVVAVLRKRAGRRAPVTQRARWHRNAGIFMAVVIAGHVAAVRGPSWFAGIHPGFAGLSFTMDWMPGYFYPYYFLLGTAGLYHGLNGVGLAAARLGWRLRIGPRALVLATAIAGIVLGTALLGFGGLLYDVGDPYENAYARLVLSIVGGRSP